MKPIIGITMGDPAGNGPEITVKALADPAIYELCRPLVVGDCKVLEQAKHFVGKDEITIHRCDSVEEAPIVFEREYFPEEMTEDEQDGIVVEKTAPHEFRISGAPVDKMLGYTHLESERGFDFFQKFMRDRGIIRRLEALEIEEGDTVEVGDISFEYYS